MFFSRMNSSGSSRHSRVPSRAEDDDDEREQGGEEVGQREPEGREAPADSSDQRSTPNRMSIKSSSEGYPSWLPKRPAPPVPQSTFQSSRSGQAVYLPGPASPLTTPGDQYPSFVGGRKPTPRSVRIVSMPDASQDPDGGGDNRREPTDHTRVASNPMTSRVWSRATGLAVSPTMFSNYSGVRPMKPKFRSSGLDLDLLRDPSIKSHIYFYLYPLLVFAHIPLQTYFDFNAVFVLIQASRFPDPVAPGVPGSGRNWSLGAAAYVACWFVWIFVVFLLYEVVYSFARRWRLKRPLILPIYLSSPAFNLAALTSYSRFCFLQHIRWSAFASSLRVGIAETCFFYAQNTANVALLLPRAGLSLALLLTFSSSNPELVSQANSGVSQRDGTFFRPSDGALTDYARGVLIANAAWTAWRVLVLIASWIGLWLVSGYSCGGICGPRFRWEEEDANEKRAMSIYADADSDLALTWDWKEDTRQRIQDAWEFCASIRSIRSAGKEKMVDQPITRDEAQAVGGFEGIERVMAAIGLGGGNGASAAQSRRGVMSEGFFAPSPVPLTPGVETADAPPPAVTRDSANSKDGRPLKELPYPFATTAAQVSSEDQHHLHRVPFPPSPHPSGSPGEDDDDDGQLVELHDEDEDEYEDGEETGYEETGVSPSSGRASGSMSSLGHPVGSRYPFSFRRPGGRGSSMSSAAISSSMGTRLSPTSSHHHTPSRATNTTSSSSKSPGNTASSNSRSNNSHGSRYPPSTSESHGSSGSPPGSLPMPPRHPGRARAGTVPVHGSPSMTTTMLAGMPASPTPAAYRGGRGVGGRPRARTRAESAATTAMSEFGLLHQMDDPDHDDLGDTSLGSGTGSASGPGDVTLETRYPESSIAEEVDEDVLGLLSSSGGEQHSGQPSPRSSLSALRQRASASFTRVHQSASSRANSHSSSASNSNSNSASSRANSHSQHSSPNSNSSSSRASAASRPGSRSRHESLVSQPRSRRGSLYSPPRSRTQSLIHSLNNLSASSIDLVTGRFTGRYNAETMSRLEEDARSFSAGTHSRSGSGTTSEGGVLSGGSENYTFGQPMRLPVSAVQRVSEESESGSTGSQRRKERQERPSVVIEAQHGAEGSRQAPVLRSVRSSSTMASAAPSELTIMSGPTPTSIAFGQGALTQEGEPDLETIHEPAGGVPIPASPRRTSLSGQQQPPAAEGSTPSGDSSLGAWSSAPQSFITPPATIEGESSGESMRTMGHGGLHMHHHGPA